MFYWIFLAFAIVSEVIGTLSMKWASTNNAGNGYIIMLVMISLSYISLSFAIKRISLGVAYAIWEGIGILLITLFSVLFFHESLSFMKLLGIFILIAGIVLIKSSSSKIKKESNHANA